MGGKPVAWLVCCRAGWAPHVWLRAAVPGSECSAVPGSSPDSCPFQSPSLLARCIPGRLSGLGLGVAHTEGSSPSPSASFPAKLGLLPLVDACPLLRNPVRCPRSPASMQDHHSPAVSGQFACCKRSHHLEIPLVSLLLTLTQYGVAISEQREDVQSLLGLVSVRVLVG